MVKDKISLNIFKENTKSSKFPWLLIGNSFTEPYRKVMATVRTWYMSASSFQGLQSDDRDFFNSIFHSSSSADCFKKDHCLFSKVEVLISAIKFFQNLICSHFH